MKKITFHPSYNRFVCYYMLRITKLSFSLLSKNTFYNLFHIVLWYMHCCRIFLWWTNLFLFLLLSCIVICKLGSCEYWFKWWPLLMCLLPSLCEEFTLLPSSFYCIVKCHPYTRAGWTFFMWNWSCAFIIFLSSNFKDV